LNGENETNELLFTSLLRFQKSHTQIILGQSPTSDTYNVIKEGLPFFQGKAEFTELYPIPEKWCSKPKKVAERFDILLSVRAPVGAINIADQQCCIGRGLASIRYPENYKFIWVWLFRNSSAILKKTSN